MNNESLFIDIESGQVRALLSRKVTVPKMEKALPKQDLSVVVGPELRSYGFTNVVPISLIAPAGQSIVATSQTMSFSMLLICS